MTRETRYGIGAAAVFVFFFLWLTFVDDSLFGIQTDREIIQAVDVLLFVAMGIIVLVCMWLERIWYDKIHNPGGRLTRKQIEKLEREKFIEEENKIW